MSAASTLAVVELVVVAVLATGVDAAGRDTWDCILCAVKGAAY